MKIMQHDQPMLYRSNNYSCRSINSVIVFTGKNFCDQLKIKGRRAYQKTSTRRKIIKQRLEDMSNSRNCQD